MIQKVKCAPLLLLAFCLIAIPLLCVAPDAHAANDDFNVNYDFSPDKVGYLGADMDLLLIVENTGDTDITWVGVGIDTETPFSDKWNQSPPIHPGFTRRINFTVPFVSGDLDEVRTMQVTMNNDGDPMADGSKTFTFVKHATNDVFTITSSISPSGPYFPGDTVTVTTQFHNNMPNIATGVTSEVFLRNDSRILILPPYGDESILPGASNTSTLTYTLQNEDIGMVAFQYELHATILGREYYQYDHPIHFEVSGLPIATFIVDIPDASSEPSLPEVKFTAGLSASPTEIDAGGTVDFQVTVNNTGDDGIEEFEIRNAEGALELNTGGIDAGDGATFTISRELAESCDVSFTVIGQTGDVSFSQETNPVHITVREAAESATPAVSVTQSTVTDTSLPEASEVPAQAIEQTSMDTPIILLLAMIAVLLLAILALIIVVLLRRRRQKQQ